MAEFQLSISLKDAYGRKTTRGIGIVAASYSDAKTTAAAFVSVYGDCTDLRILKYTVSEEFPIVDVVTPLANVDRGMTVNYELLPLNGKEAVVKIPGPPLDMFDSEGVLDIFDARITALTSVFLLGEVRISDGEIVGALLRGKLDK